MPFDPLYVFIKKNYNGIKYALNHKLMIDIHWGLLYGNDHRRVPQMG